MNFSNSSAFYLFVKTRRIFLEAIRFTSCEFNIPINKHFYGGFNTCILQMFA